MVAMRARETVRPAETEPGTGASRAAAARARLLVAFGTVFLFWGGTYLAIRFAIETIPPFLMAGSRFLLAGLLIWGWQRWRGAAAAGIDQWRAATLVGALLIVGGNGGVVWAEQRVPSALAALLISITPLWMVLFDGLRPGGPRPSWRVLLGIALGLAGTAILLGPEQLLGGGRIDPVGAAVLLMASVSWAAGSIVARSARLPQNPLLATGMEMIAGGALLLVLGLVLGEIPRLRLEAVTGRSLISWGYLVVFGSLAGFTAYLWLLRHTSTARASTYAYVTPVVAIVIGWTLGGEPITARVLLAAAVIVGAVALMTWPPGRRDATPDRGSRAATAPSGHRGPAGQLPPDALSHKVLAEDQSRG
jgi:drug/metabolite transporter (DMT)-like permease